MTMNEVYLGVTALFLRCDGAAGAGVIPAKRRHGRHAYVLEGLPGCA